MPLALRNVTMPGSKMVSSLVDPCTTFFKYHSSGGSGRGKENDGFLKTLKRAPRRRNVLFSKFSPMVTLADNSAVKGESESKEGCGKILVVVESNEMGKSFFKSLVWRNGH
ncbi:hypothetical protein Tco_0278124 [Tanacetum coccineum]